MAITLEFAANTQTVSTTELSLINGNSTIATSSSNGIYQAFVDLNAVAAGDIFEFKIYEKTITGGTQRVVYVASFANAQGAPIMVTPTLVLGIGWDMSIKKISGTDRSIVWRISKVA